MTVKKLIGTDPNQIPLNRDLGDLAYMNAKSVLTNVIPPNISEVSSSDGLQTPARNMYLQKAFCVNKASNVGVSSSHTLCAIKIDGVASFSEMWITVRWGSRLQNIADATTYYSERKFGVNRFNGNATNWWEYNSQVPANVSSHGNIYLTTANTYDILIQNNFSSSTSQSSWNWGVIEIMSLEQLPVQWYV